VFRGDCPTLVRYRVFIECSEWVIECLYVFRGGFQYVSTLNHTVTTSKHSIITL